MYIKYSNRDENQKKNNWLTSVFQFIINKYFVRISSFEI